MQLLIGDIMDYKDYSDGELIYMISESNEEANEILFEKYKYIVNILIKRYLKTTPKLGIEYNDLYQEALIGFNDAVTNYKDNKEASLARFISVCIEHRIQMAIAKAGRQKHKPLNESLSLEHTYEGIKVPLMYVLSDNSENDPLESITKEEEAEELINQIKEELSDFESKVFSLMINHLDYNEIASILDKKPKQIDNTIQRVKQKVRKVLEQRK